MMMIICSEETATLHILVVHAQIILLTYGSSPAVPEPAAILLALFGLSLLPRRRRR